MRETWLISGIALVAYCKQLGIDHVVGDVNRIGAPGDVFALVPWRATIRVHGLERLEALLELDTGEFAILLVDRMS